MRQQVVKTAKEHILTCEPSAQHPFVDQNLQQICLIQKVRPHWYGRRTDFRKHPQLLLRGCAANIQVLRFRIN